MGVRARAITGRRVAAARRLLVAALALACLVLWAGPASAQVVGIRKIDASRFPTVGLTVSVDQNVSPSSIQVTENGRPVTPLQARSLRQTGGTFDVVLAIDTSDSVAGAPLQTAVSAAGNFVRNLPAGIPVGVVTFDDQPSLVQPVTTDHAAALAAIGSISGTRPGTALYDGVGMASRMFTGSAQHNVVLLTDGADRGSTGSLQNSIAAAKAAHAFVLAVGLGSHADTPVLKTLAKSTSGEYLPAVQANLSSIYQNLARGLTNQYLVTYRSQAPANTQVTVGVAAAGGQDEVVMLTPKPPVTVPSSLPPQPVAQPALHGTWALAFILVLTFATVFLILLMLFGANARARRRKELARRMSATAPPADVKEGEEKAGLSSWIPEPLVQVAEQMAGAGDRGLLPALEKRFERAGVRLRGGEFLVLSAAGAVGGGLLGAIFLPSVWFGLLVAVVGAAVPTVVLSIVAQRRAKRLQNQLPDVLMMIASSLRAGHGFLQALDTVSKEVGEPTGSEVARVVAEIRLGRPTDEALNAMAERIDNEDFGWAAMAVNIQREVGGNLAEILDTVSTTVRERAEIKRQVDVLSAEGRLSAGILIALPFLMAIYMAKVNRSYIALLFTTRMGLILFGIAVGLLAVGIGWIRKVVRIDV